VQLTCVEDYYTEFVCLNGLSESLFWNEEYAFLLGIYLTKTAHDAYAAGVRQKAYDKASKK